MTHPYNESVSGSWSDLEIINFSEFESNLWSELVSDLGSGMMNDSNSATAVATGAAIHLKMLVQLCDKV